MSSARDAARLTHLHAIVARLPDKPGSYQFYDSAGTIIYVGKAKSLKNRVASYFHKEVDRRKTELLVAKICDITYTVVATEADALLLENALIKKYQPRYNVLLKDGKTYPSLCITRETLPRVIKTRRIDKKSGEFFGPYSHVPTLYGLLDLVRKICCPRRCNTPMTVEGIQQGKYKACLEYHLHNCHAPCIGAQTIEEYGANIAIARQILAGKTTAIRQQLTNDMLSAAKELRFEDAEVIKQQLLLLQSYVARSEVVSNTIGEIDVFSLTESTSQQLVFINYLHVTDGIVNSSFTYEYQRKIDESAEELLLLAIMEIRQRMSSHAKEVVVPFPLSWTLPEDIRLTVPVKGDRRRLLDLSILNGKQYLFDRTKQAETLNPEQRQTRLMHELQELLHLPKLPVYIECFDNSHISGSDAVAACVVYRQMKPAKKDYRKYIIRSAPGNDDYASMDEVVRRRYSRLIAESLPMPDLIITDGGAGQMAVVRRVLNELSVDIPIAGLAKDRRHRTNELLFGDPAQVVTLSTNSDLFRVLSQLQDEVHRVAISYHRQRRSQSALHSELDGIPGVGAKTRETLLSSFSTVAAIAEASIDSLTAILPPSRAHAIYRHFHPDDKQI